MYGAEGAGAPGATGRAAGEEGASLGLMSPGLNPAVGAAFAGVDAAARSPPSLAGAGDAAWAPIMPGVVLDARVGAAAAGMLGVAEAKCGV